MCACSCNPFCGCECHKERFDKLRGVVDLVNENAVTWKKDLDAALLQISEAMKACPWATHSTNHSEPKNCIACLSSIAEMREAEIEKWKSAAESFGKRVDVAERLLSEAVRLMQESVGYPGRHRGPGMCTCDECTAVRNFLTKYFAERPKDAIANRFTSTDGNLGQHVADKRIDPAPICTCPPSSMLTVEGCKAHHG